MITKQVKEYSKRQRIDLSKNDGLTPGQDVVIIPLQKYDKVKQDVLDLQNELMTARNETDMLLQINSNLENQIKDLKSQEVNLKEIIKDVTAPIYEKHKEELEDKDKQIKQLEIQLNTLKAKTNQYNLDMQGLNAIDIAIFRKHKKLIQDFNDEITIIGVEQKIINTDSKAIPGTHNQEQ